jgi:predicted enzyme related to lactoylglutathione lyase
MLRLITILCLSLSMSLPAISDRLPSIGTGDRLPGKFIWFDLVTPDTTQSRDFYRALFGWEFEAISTDRGRYELIRHEGRALGGLFQPSAAQTSALWLSALSVQDIDSATTYATNRGSRIVLPKRELPELGSRVLLQDPQGALIVLLQTNAGDPADEPVAVGEFFWLDLFTSDTEAAATFYAGLAGYEVDTRQFDTLTRRVLASQGYARAGIAPLPEQVDRPGWLPYVLVDDVSATVDRARQLGGEPMVLPNRALLDGRLAVLADPNGGIIGILEWSADAMEGK